MGKGRRPLPNAVKALRGNPGHRAVNESEPIVNIGDADPVCPDTLHADAKKEWNEILPILKRMKVVTAADSKALAAYCHAFHRWQQAEREIERLGIMLGSPILLDQWEEGKDGQAGKVKVLAGIEYKKNPAVGISFEAMKTMKTYLIEFGLTPASRGKLHVEKPKEDDPFDAWIKNKTERNAANAPGSLKN